MFMVKLLSAGMSGVVMYMMTSLPKSIVPWINTPVTWLRSSTRFVSPYPSLSGVEGMSLTDPCHQLQLQTVAVVPCSLLVLFICKSFNTMKEENMLKLASYEDVGYIKINTMI